MASVSKPEEIDRFAEERGWFHPKWNGNLYKMIQAYLSGELDLSAVVPRTADPIDQHYSTADGGRAIHNAEKLAEDQRPYYDVVKAEEMWGVPLRPDELPPPSSTRTTRSWIMVLGKKLYDLAADETSGNSKREDFVGCGPLWEAHRDKRIPSRERWRFWKERLRILRDKETLSQETRDAAAEAFRKIEEIENLLDSQQEVFLSNTSAEFAVSTSSIEKKMSEKKLSTRVKQHTFDLKREPYITKLINPEP